VKKALLIFSIVLFVFGTVNAQSSQKIGFVNSQVIFAQLPAAIKVQSDLDAMIQQWQNSLDSMTQDLQAAYADYQQKEATMAADKQQEAQQSLVAQQQRMVKCEKYKKTKG